MAVRDSRGLVGKRQRRTKLIWRCVLGGGLAALATHAVRTFVSPNLGPGHTVGQKRTLLHATAADPFSEVQKKAEKQIKDVEQGMKDVQDSVAELAPDRLQAKAEAAVNDAVEGLLSDDGKVLDTSGAAGSVGAVAVALAVLPYIPVSLYSSYVLVTTGTGLPPGPNGFYGLAEGLATLVIFAMSLWSLTSFVTRARGLPEGPFNLLGATQALSLFATVIFAITQYLNAGPPSDNPFRGLGVSRSGQQQQSFDPFAALPDGVKSKLKDVAEDLDDAKNAALSSASKSVSDSVSKVTASVSEAASDTLSKQKITVPKLEVPKFDAPQIDVPDFGKLASEAKEKASAAASSVAEKASSAASTAAEKATSVAPKLASKDAPDSGMDDLFG